MCQWVVNTTVALQDLTDTSLAANYIKAISAWIVDEHFMFLVIRPFLLVSITMMLYIYSIYMLNR